MHHSLIGHTVLDYRVTKLLGEGGMGNVYLAEHQKLGRQVAIKMLHGRLSRNAALRERFKNEASTLAHLQHPNIVALYDYIENEDGLFLVMEYVDGRGLDEYINTVSGPIPQERAVTMFSQILDGFQYAHDQQVVHRDIKPSNVLVNKQGIPKIMDFGIAKILSADKSLTKTGMQMGTVLYMSPEQVKGEKVDHRSDIYSLGITLFQMVTGQCPYSRDSTEFEVYNQIVNKPLPSPRQVYPGVSKRIERVICRATNKKPSKRFEDCSEFKLVLTKEPTSSVWNENPPHNTSAPNKIPVHKQKRAKKQIEASPSKHKTRKKALITAISSLNILDWIAIIAFSSIVVFMSIVAVLPKR